MPNPSMTSGSLQLLLSFSVGTDYMVGVYQGSLSPFDMLVKYRQKENGRWSRLRTPKHIHWAVDIIVKQHIEIIATQRFIDELLALWNNATPITSTTDRNQFLNTTSLFKKANSIAKKYTVLDGKGGIFRHVLNYLCYSFNDAGKDKQSKCLYV